MDRYLQRPLHIDIDRQIDRHTNRFRAPKKQHANVPEPQVSESSIDR